MRILDWLSTLCSLIILLFDFIFHLGHLPKLFDALVLYFYLIIFFIFEVFLLVIYCNYFIILLIVLVNKKLILQLLFWINFLINFILFIIIRGKLCDLLHILGLILAFQRIFWRKYIFLKAQQQFMIIIQLIS